MSDTTKIKNNREKGISVFQAPSDREIDELSAQECVRQEHTINLIASENYASPAVLRVGASVLTNKYAEGYPGKRYYAGCAVIDAVEQLAIDRCRQLFDAAHVNVQPHAGSQANMAAYHALLNPGDTILGMSLAAGGHLTHGHTVNFSGQVFKSIQYGVDRQTEQIDYGEVRRLAQEHKPHLIIAGASAYSRAIDFEQFYIIAQEVGAYFMADIAHIAGLIAADLHKSPVAFADIVTTTTHKTLRGPRGGLIMTSQQHAQAIDRAIMPGIQGGPCMQVIAAKAVAFYEALQPSFRVYQQQIINNARAMARTFHDLGYRIVSGGTDNHLFVLDLRSKQINGLEAQMALEKAGITVSRSCIPFDPEKPWITSGIRIGTPAITTRGLQEQDVITLAHWIDEILTHHENETLLYSLRQHVIRMCKDFPIYR